MTRSPIRNILFVTWDGPQTSYLEGLFLPIFARLRQEGYAFHVLQFSWASPEVRSNRAAAAAAHGIPYRAINIIKRGGPVGPGIGVLRATGHIRRAVRDWDIDTLMPRALIAALAVLRLRQREKDRLTIVFDSDGLAADERVDFRGDSPHRMAYRLLRDVEGEMVRQSDAVLCRTEAACDILHARAGAGTSRELFHVVSNGVDPARFREALSSRKEMPGRGFTLCYCGSIGVQYRLPDMLFLAKALHEHIPDLRFHIYTGSPDAVRSELGNTGLQDADWILCQRLAAHDVPGALAACDLGLALRSTRFSMSAVSPIKLGEYLMAGVPVVGTPGVGDTAPLIERGVFLASDGKDIRPILRWITEEIRPDRERWLQRCHEVAVEKLSVEAAAELYGMALSSVREVRE